MRKKRNVTWEHATMEWADNGSKLADTGYTHTHTPLTYIYNMSICNIAPVCNIVFGTVTIHLAAKHLENDM